MKADRQQVYEDLSQAMKSLRELAREYHKQGVRGKELLKIGDQIRVLADLRLSYISYDEFMKV